MSDEKSPKLNSRTAARIAAVQALYQRILAQDALEEVLAQFVADRLDHIEGQKAERSHFLKIVRGVADRQAELDELIQNHLGDGWSMERLDLVTISILRAAIFELMALPDVPLKVVINEYINVARAFLDEDQVKFVNAHLDKVAKLIRA